jgi:hypothetical protein
LVWFGLGHFSQVASVLVWYVQVKQGWAGPGSVRSGQVRSGQVRSGQVRSGQVKIVYGC